MSEEQVVIGDVLTAREVRELGRLKWSLTHIDNEDGDSNVVWEKHITETTEDYLKRFDEKITSCINPRKRKIEGFKKEILLLEDEIEFMEKTQNKVHRGFVERFNEENS